MVSGIYELNFNGQAYYIGQAQDIAARWKQHADKFRKGTAAQKMQAAYNKYGLPDFRVVIHCHKDYLDIMETYYINILNKYESCLNTSIPKLDTSIDYARVIANPNLISYSAMEMMNHAIVLNQDNDTLREQQSYEYAKAVLAEGKDKNEQLVKDYSERLARAQDTLNRLNRRGLLQRIFNYD